MLAAPLPRRGEPGQSQQPLRLSAGAAGHPRRHRVDGRRDGDVEPGELRRHLRAGAPGRWSCSPTCGRCTSSSSARVDAHRRGQGRALRGSRPRTAWWSPTPTTRRWCASPARSPTAGGEAAWYSLSGTAPPARSRSRCACAISSARRRAARQPLHARAPRERRRRRACELPLLGRHNVENFLAAATAAYRFGVPLDGDRGGGRGRRAGVDARRAARWPARRTVYDDSYNSNPDAVARALEAVAQLPAQRRWAVLGDMLELGPEAPRFHREAGQRAARLGFDPVVGVGELARELAAGAARRAPRRRGSRPRRRRRRSRRSEIARRATWCWSRARAASASRWWSTMCCRRS